WPDVAATAGAARIVIGAVGVVGAVVVVVPGDAADVGADCDRAEGNSRDRAVDAARSGRCNVGMVAAPAPVDRIVSPRVLLGHECQRGLPSLSHAKGIEHNENIHRTVAADAVVAAGGLAHIIGP